MEYRVYLSSTLKDLGPERDAIKQALDGLCVIQQSYGASEHELVESCLHDIERCHLYIIVLGMRYGHVPGRPFRNPAKLSITELEYRHAGTKKIPRLVFVKDESVIPLPHTDYRTKEHPPSRIEKFRALAGGEQRAAVFKDIPDLRERVIKDFNHFKERQDTGRKVPRPRRAGTVTSNEDVRRGYVQWLKRECEQMVLLGLGARERQNVRIGQVYVPALTQLDSDKSQAAPDKNLWRSPEYEPLLHRVGRESLYVPGPPGSGKSTFCQWTALATASGSVARRGLPAGFEEQMPEGLRGRFPFLCQLRRWAAAGPWLKGNGHWTRVQLERSLAGWIDSAKPGGLTSGAFIDALERGACLLVFDGVDEIPERVDQHYPRRNFLTGLMDAMPEWTRRGHRVLVTSRPYGVEDTDKLRLGLAQADVAPIPRALQDEFVGRWFVAANALDSETKARGLIAHLDERADLDDLRPNPMLLTALCVKYDSDLRLPGDLYRLYDAVVDLVLYKRFNTESERDLARLRLAAIALAMHQGLPGHARATPEAEVSLDDVDEALIELTRTDRASEQAGAEAVERRESLLSNSGLLLPRPGKRAAFYHLSIQEFLAAVRLRRVLDDVAQVLAARRRAPEWRRTLRFLFCAIADQKSPEQALKAWSPLIDDLDPERLAEDPNPALLLADCLEVGHARRWSLIDFAKPYRQACEDALTCVDPHGRAHLWRILGRIGLDDRPGVGVRDGVPDIAWVDIPEGALRREVVTLPAFRLARYPVTNAQFDAFIEASGYEHARWWQWPKWRPTPVKPAFPHPNHPRDTVSWFEAMAFCAWLDARLRGQGEIPAGHFIRLPTEQEWERAASGEDGREYPWGDDYEVGRANVYEGQAARSFNLRQTSAVGIYPGGSSPYGADDMAGNVLEWCLNTYEAKTTVTDAARVLRGGSWSGHRVIAHATYRCEPGQRFNNFGFRVVCARKY